MAGSHQGRFQCRLQMTLAGTCVAATIPAPKESAELLECIDSHDRICGVCSGVRRGGSERLQGCESGLLGSELGNAGEQRLLKTAVTLSGVSELSAMVTRKGSEAGLAKSSASRLPA